MAWTMLLVWIFGLTIITGSANKQGRITRRNLEIVPKSPDNTAHESWNRITPVQENGDQRTQCKQAHNKKYRTVLAGSPSAQYQLEIPEHCVELGICEDVINYPQDEVNKVIAKMTDLSMFQNDELTLRTNTQTSEYEENNWELCGFKRKTIHPKIAVDTNGIWHLVLNKEGSLQKGYNVEVCEGPKCPCPDNIIGFVLPGYEAICKQKFVYVKMPVFYNNSMIEKKLQVPSCCACVAKTVARF